MAERIMEKWQKLAESQIKKLETPVQPKRQAAAPPATAAAQPKKPKVSTTVKPAPAPASSSPSLVGSFDIFSKLAAAPVSLPKIKKEKAAGDAPQLRRTSSQESNDKLNISTEQPSLSTNVTQSPTGTDSFPSYSKRENSVTDLDGSSKKKKSVKFKAEVDLQDVRYFSIDDAPITIVRFSSKISRALRPVKICQLMNSKMIHYSLRYPGVIQKVLLIFIYLFF
jgi:hypothetical protein